MMLCSISDTEACNVDRQLSCSAFWAGPEAVEEQAQEPAAANRKTKKKGKKAKQADADEQGEAQKPPCPGGEAMKKRERSPSSAILQALSQNALFHVRGSDSGIGRGMSDENICVCS